MFIKKTKSITTPASNNTLDYFITNSTLIKLKNQDGNKNISDHYGILMQITLEKSKSIYQDPLIRKDYENYDQEKLLKIMN